MELMHALFTLSSAVTLKGIDGSALSPASLPHSLLLLPQATAKGALKAVPVAVSGAFHTELMQPARDALTEARAKSAPGTGIEAAAWAAFPAHADWSMAAGLLRRVGSRNLGCHASCPHPTLLSNSKLLSLPLPPLPHPSPQVLASVTINEPRIPIYSNVTAQPFKDAAEIAALLPRQLVEAVQWEGTIRALLAAGEGGAGGEGAKGEGRGGFTARAAWAVQGEVRVSVHNLVTPCVGWWCCRCAVQFPYLLAACPTSSPAAHLRCLHPDPPTFPPISPPPFP